MPYFAWRGVDCVGSYKRGAQFARSEVELDAELFKRGIALLDSKQKSISWFVPAITMADKIDFFKQLSVLVDAGMLLPDALTLVLHQITSVRLQALVRTIADAVQEGESLSSALEKSGCVFDRMAITHIRIGEESGTVPSVLQSLCDMYEVQAQFYKKLRAALLMPLITFLFFIAVAVCMLWIILPRFADLFTSYHQELPAMARTLLAISRWMSSWYALIAIVGFLSWMAAMYWWASSRYGKAAWDRIILMLPIIGPIMIDTFRASFFQSIANLMAGGLRLVPAVQLIVSEVKNRNAQACVMHIEQVLQEGGSLSHALITEPNDFFTPEIIALVTVGQESGRLPELCGKIAQVYQGRVLDRLTLYATLVQPVCMLLLGLLVAILVFAIYGPIFNMATMMSV